MSTQLHDIHADCDKKAVVALDELDKGTSKRSLARSLEISRSTVLAIEENRERYTGNPSSST